MDNKRMRLFCRKLRLYKSSLVETRDNPTATTNRAYHPNHTPQPSQYAKTTATKFAKTVNPFANSLINPVKAQSFKKVCIVQRNLAKSNHDAISRAKVTGKRMKMFKTKRISLKYPSQLCDSAAEADNFLSFSFDNSKEIDTNVYDEDMPPPSYGHDSSKKDLVGVININIKRNDYVKGGGIIFIPASSGGESNRKAVATVGTETTEGDSMPFPVAEKQTCVKERVTWVRKVPRKLSDLLNSSQCSGRIPLPALNMNNPRLKPLVNWSYKNRDSVPTKAQSIKIKAHRHSLVY